MRQTPAYLRGAQHDLLCTPADAAELEGATTARRRRAFTSTPGIEPGQLDGVDTVVGALEAFACPALDGSQSPFPRTLAGAGARRGLLRATRNARLRAIRQARRTLEVSVLYEQFDRLPTRPASLPIFEAFAALSTAWLRPSRHAAWLRMQHWLHEGFHLQNATGAQR